MVNRTQRLFGELNQKVDEAPLSKLLPKFTRLSHFLGNKAAEHWANLELHGYYNTNPVWTDETEIPSYRKVGGQHHDNFGRPIIIRESRLGFVSEYPLRFSTVELEAMEKKEEQIKIADPVPIEFFREKFNVDISFFSFASVAVAAVLVGIRSRLAEFLLEFEEEYPELSNDEQSTLPEDHSTKLDDFHPRVAAIASSLYRDGHYRQAILDTFIGLVDDVKKQSNRSDLDGVGLMQSVFSVNNPAIKLSDDQDQQLGYMWLFSGAVMALRNIRAHTLLVDNDPRIAYEWLAFASSLFRLLDLSK